VAVVAITGAASGIGAATRRRLEAGGDTVVGIDLRAAEIQADLSTGGGRDAALAELARHCDAQLDALVLCAGLGPVPAPPATIASVNYFGAIDVLEGAEKFLRAGSRPAVVAVCSNAATTVPGIPEDLVAAMLAGDEAETRRLAEAHGGNAAYAGSKLALTRAIRRRAPAWAGNGIRLNGVAPGAISTPLLDQTLADPLLGQLVRDFPIPTGGFGKPDDIAAAIAFLLGTDASFCCGSILFVDGGTDALVRGDAF
jgi:NAD(P)-dependent dehydrogenase (short-subunit alcohol dehydrogenase family)